LGKANIFYILSENGIKDLQNLRTDCLDIIKILGYQKIIPQQ